MTTNDEIIASLSKKRQEKINKMANEEIAKWGGKRVGAGRKPKNGIVLSLQIRVSEEEKAFLNCARKNNFDYKSVMD